MNKSKGCKRYDLSLNLSRHSMQSSARERGQTSASGGLFTMVNENGINSYYTNGTLTHEISETSISKN